MFCDDLSDDLKNIPEKERNFYIFVHAGIDEEAEDMWEYETREHIFLWKYPAETGYFYGDYKIVAGHVGTSQIADNPRFHDIYYDGQSHYYIDGTVQESGNIPVIMVDTGTDQYYRVSEGGNGLVLPYEKD